MKGLYELAQSVREQTGYPALVTVEDTGVNRYNVTYRFFEEASDTVWKGKFAFQDLPSDLSLHDRILAKIVDAIEESLTCETMKGMVIAWR